MVKKTGWKMRVFLCLIKNLHNSNQSFTVNFHDWNISFKEVLSYKIKISVKYFHSKPTVFRCEQQWKRTAPRHVTMIKKQYKFEVKLPQRQEFHNFYSFLFLTFHLTYRFFCFVIFHAYFFFYLSFRLIMFKSNILVSHGCLSLNL